MEASLGWTVRDPRFEGGFGVAKICDLGPAMSRRVTDRDDIAIAQESGHAADTSESLKLARVLFS
jgi:hypothetical protein